MLCSYSPKGEVSTKLVTLVELKFGHFLQVRNDHFSQLIHAAALAFKSKMWNDRLVFCVASFTHWHIFILEVCCFPSRPAHFVIKNFTFSCGNVDYALLTVSRDFTVT